MPSIIEIIAAVTVVVMLVLVLVNAQISQKAINVVLLIIALLVVVAKWNLRL